MGRSSVPPEAKGVEVLRFGRLLNCVLKHGNFIPTPTLMTRTTTLERVGVFNAEFRTAADIDLWLRMARWKPIGLIDEHLHKYRVTSFQGSAKINRLRVVGADFYVAMDRYLSERGPRIHVTRSILSWYDMEKSTDLILCSMNQLVRNRMGEASMNLRAALRVRHLVLAFRRPKRLRYFAAAVFLLLGIYLGMGRVCGQLLNRVQRERMRRRTSPKGKTEDPMQRFTLS